MNRYTVVGALVAGTCLGGFLLAHALNATWATTGPQLSAQGRPLAAGVGVALLMGDAVLPVPSSLVMIALGNAFGAAGGLVLALAGRVGGTLVGFAIGRRLTGPAPRPGSQDAARLLRRWGAVAIILSRPVPVVSESVAVLAGMSPMSWRRAGLAAAAGALPEAALCAWAGATVGTTSTGIILWLMLLAAAVWALASSGRRATRLRHRTTSSRALNAEGGSRRR